MLCREQLKTWVIWKAQVRRNEVRESCMRTSMSSTTAYGCFCFPAATAGGSAGSTLLSPAEANARNLPVSKVILDTRGASRGGAALACAPEGGRTDAGRRARVDARPPHLQGSLLVSRSQQEGKASAYGSIRATEHSDPKMRLPSARRCCAFCTRLEDVVVALRLRLGLHPGVTLRADTRDLAHLITPHSCTSATAAQHEQQTKAPPDR